MILQLLNDQHAREYYLTCGLPRWHSIKKSAYQCRRFSPWVRKFPWKRRQQQIPVFSPEKFQGQGLVGYSLWGHKESNTTEHAFDFYFSILRKNIHTQCASVLATENYKAVNTFIICNEWLFPRLKGGRVMLYN